MSRRLLQHLCRFYLSLGCKAWRLYSQRQSLTGCFAKTLDSVKAKKLMLVAMMQSGCGIRIGFAFFIFCGADISQGEEVSRHRADSSGGGKNAAYARRIDQPVKKLVNGELHWKIHESLQKFVARNLFRFLVGECLGNWQRPIIRWFSQQGVEVSA